jgi:hypothetical protein
MTRQGLFGFEHKDKIEEVKQLQEHHRLQPGNLKAFSAAGIPALKNVIAPDHVRPELREASAVPLVSLTSQRLALGANQPSDVVSVALMAFVAIQHRRLRRFRFVKKVPLFHTRMTPA